MSARMPRSAAIAAEMAYIETAIETLGNAHYCAGVEREEIAAAISDLRDLIRRLEDEAPFVRAAERRRQGAAE